MVSHWDLGQHGGSAGNAEQKSQAEHGDCSGQFCSIRYAACLGAVFSLIMIGAIAVGRCGLISARKPHPDTYIMLRCTLISFLAR